MRRKHILKAIAELENELETLSIDNGAGANDLASLTLELEEKKAMLKGRR